MYAGRWRPPHTPGRLRCKNVADPYPRWGSAPTPVQGGVVWGRSPPAGAWGGAPSNILHGVWGAAPTAAAPWPPSGYATETYNRMFALTVVAPLLSLGFFPPDQCQLHSTKSACWTASSKIEGIGSFKIPRKVFYQPRTLSIKRYSIRRKFALTQI